MAKMQGLAHIGVFITDIERSKKFYHDILEFETIYECKVDEADGTVTKVAFVQNGNLTLELVQTANPQIRKDGWVDHIALKVEDIASIQKTLAERGVKFETEEIVHNVDVFPNGSKWLTFRGPDNEHLEISEVL
ncbi:MAG: VOC family protein [Christensenellaceae bacterium]